LFGLNAADDGVEDSQFGLLDRRDRIVDRERRLVL
jgi:hypothetical protein